MAHLRYSEEKAARGDGIKFKTEHTVRQYTALEWAWLKAKLGRDPRAWELEAEFAPFDEQHDSTSNLVTTAGLTRVIARLTGTGTALTTTSARLGVGDGTTAASAGDTDLSAAAGATHRYFQPLDSVTPSGASFTAVATYAPGDANFTWSEWGIDILNSGTATGGTTVNDILWDHKLATMITKSSSASASLTVTVTAS